MNYQNIRKVHDYMDSQSWFLDELSHAGDEHIDPEYVATYDQKAGTNPLDDLTTLQQCGLNKTHTLIDFGAGTGTFALAAAPHCQQVIAVDISRVMIEQLRKKAQQAGIANITTVESSFLTYDHQSDAVDFVYSRHALHHLSDFWKAIALRRIANILKSGGIFYLRDLIYSCSIDEIESVLNTWLGNASDSPDLGWTRTELVTHIQEEHSTYSWLLEAMLAQAGFEVQQVTHHASKIYSDYVCVRV